MNLQNIYALDYNIHPDTEKDFTESLNKLITDVPDGTVLHLAKGTYQFHASHGTAGSYSLSNSEPVENRTASLTDNRIFHSERQNSRKTGTSLFIIQNCPDAVLRDNTLIGTFSLNTSET
ncbi:MAG: hypothetical protein IKY52_03880 [Clostridia bacterium]|nr:hypothetical protein [Clostridia bacterium]